MDILQKSNKYTIGAAIAIAAAALGALLYFYYRKQNTVNNYAPPKQGRESHLEPLRAGEGMVLQANTRNGGSRSIDPESRIPTLVYLYANWCGFCQKMQGEWEQVEAALQGKIRTVKIESEDPRMANFQVPGFPTIRACPQGLEADAVMVDFTGPRTANDIIAFAMQTLSRPPPSGKGGETRIS